MNYTKKAGIVAFAAVLSLAGVTAASAQTSITVGGSAGAGTNSSAVTVGAQASLSVRIGRADQELNRRLAALNDLSVRVQAMHEVKADAKSKITAEVQSQI